MSHPGFPGNVCHEIADGARLFRVDKSHDPLLGIGGEFGELAKRLEFSLEIILVERVKCLRKAVVLVQVEITENNVLPPGIIVPTHF